MTWHRVVLLDAHAAANPTTQRAKAATALMAGRRWAVSGPDAKLGRGKGQVDPSDLLKLVGVACSRTSWRSGGPIGALMRERRGDLASLTARGCEGVGETDAEEEGRESFSDSDDDV